MSRSVPVSLIPPELYKALKSVENALMVYEPGATTSPTTSTFTLRVEPTERLTEELL